MRDIDALRRDGEGGLGGCGEWPRQSRSTGARGGSGGRTAHWVGEGGGRAASPCAARLVVP